MQDVAGPDPVGLDPQLHAGRQPHPLAGPAGVGGLAVAVHQGPVGHGAAVAEDGLADQLQLDVALQAAGGPDQQVVGVVIGRGSGVGGDAVVALAGAHGQRVADLDPAGRGAPMGDQGVGAGLIGPGHRHVDPERPQPERPRLPVQQRPEHTGESKRGTHNQSTVPSAATNAPVWQLDKNA